MLDKYDNNQIPNQINGLWIAFLFIIALLGVFSVVLAIKSDSTEHNLENNPVVVHCYGITTKFPKGTSIRRGSVDKSYVLTTPDGKMFEYINCTITRIPEK